MNNFSQQFLDQLRQAVQLSDLIGSAVTWDKGKSNFRKRDYWSPCPLHAEKTASFHVRDHESKFHCFGCKQSGDHFTWLIEHQGMTFPEAVRHVADLAGISVPDISPRSAASEVQRTSLLDVMAAADKWYRTRWHVKSDAVLAAADYLKARGVTGDTAKLFGIGYAPKYGVLSYLREAGFSEQVMVDAGLAARNERDNSIYERFRERIMFPIHDVRGRVIAFGGRAMREGPKVAKYLNSPETDLYDKSRTLYNMHRARPAIVAGGQVHAVEGYLDVIALHQAGLENVVSPCGTALTDEQLVLLWRNAADPVLCFDGDAAGLAAASKAADTALPMLRPAQTVRFVTLPAGQDPDDMMSDNAGRFEFVDYLADAVPLHDFLWRRLKRDNDRSSPEFEAAFDQECANMVSEIDEAKVRKAYARIFSQRIAREFGYRVNLNKLVGRKRHGKMIDGKVQQLPAQVAGVFHDQGSQNPHPSNGGRGAEIPVIKQPELLAGSELDLELARYELTDMANAHRFVARNKHRFRWSDELGWLAFDGRRWARPGAAHMVAKAVEQTILQIKNEAQALIDGEDDEVFSVKKDDTVIMLSDALDNWCKSSQAASKIRSIFELAKAHLAVTTNELDSHPYKLVVLNGTLSFGAQYEYFVHFSPHDHTDLITKLAPVTYDPDATAPIYRKFLEMVQPEATDRDYLHTVGGLSLTGDASVQAMWYFYGRGSNGKSTMIEAWSQALGDYAQTVPIETFLDAGRSRTGDQATPHLVPLVGARLVRASEPKKGAKLEEGLIKEVTGGEPMKVRELNKSFFDFTPQFKLIISGNYKPEIRGTDEGIWRRMHLVNWPVQVPDDKKDLDLVKKLSFERSGILNYLIEGLQRFFLEGLRDTESVQQATAEYREDSDPLGQFLDHCCNVTNDDQDKVSAAELYEIFAAWCAANGEYVWKTAGFGRGMRDRGFRRRKISTNYWLGLELKVKLSSFEQKRNWSPDDDM